MVVEKDYEHFSCPLILTVENVSGKIRNLKYRYIKNESLSPDEVDKYCVFQYQLEILIKNFGYCGLHFLKSLQ